MSRIGLYRAGPIRRNRRTQARVEQLDRQILGALASVRAAEESERPLLDGLVGLLTKERPG
jgi:hypothetical protein